MGNRTDKAAELHNKGYNCAQAVACSFCDEFGIDEAAMFRLTEGMGLGMGCMEGTCGAVNGAVTILGLLNSSANLRSQTQRDRHIAFKRTCRDI